MRPTNEELSSMSPEFDYRWSTYFSNAPDKPTVMLLPFAWWVLSLPDELTRSGLIFRLSVMLVGILQSLAENTLIYRTSPFVFFLVTIFFYSYTDII